MILYDEQDREMLDGFTWHVNSWGYARTNVKQSDGSHRGVLMHRMILKPEQEEAVDHINGNKLDNRRGNLRVAPPWVNQSPYKGRKFKGVYREGLRFRAQIKASGKTFYLGMFDKEEDAARAYDRRALELHGTLARVNFA